MITTKKAIYESLDSYKEAVALRMKEIILEEFFRQATIEGDWDELSYRTVAKKGHDTILQQTGELSESAYAEKQPSGDWKVGIRSSTFNPAVHEYGIPGHMPARPIIGPARRQVNREIIHNKSSPERAQAENEMMTKLSKVWVYE